MAVDRRVAGRQSPVQWGDLSAHDRRIVSHNVRESGAAATSARQAIERERAGAEDATRSAPRRRKAAASARSFESVLPHLTDRPITLQGASAARAGLVKDAVARTAVDDPGGYPRGYDWYLQAGDRLSGIAGETGLDVDRVIDASATMSPQNSPENEQAAVRQLARLESINPTLGFDADAQAKLGVGKSARFRDLTPEQVGGLANTKLRSHIAIDPEFTEDSPGVLSDLSRGGAHRNVAGAVDILRTGATIHDKYPATSAAKINSYAWNLREAAHSTPAERDEYHARYRDYESPDQGRLDLFGLKDSTEGILDPYGHTAEDTWMNAVSSRQALPAVVVEGSGSHKSAASPAKTIYSQTREYDVRRTMRDQKTGAIVRAEVPKEVSGGALRHAWNNKATQMAAEQLSRRQDTQLPAVPVQAVSWTEARVQANKDPEYNRATARRQKAEAHEALRERPDPNQLSMFD